MDLNWLYERPEVPLVSIERFRGFNTKGWYYKKNNVGKGPLDG